MTDPIAEYESELKKLETKKEAAVQALRERLNEEEAAVRETAEKIAELTGTAISGAQDGPRKRKRRSSYVMTPEHREAMRRGRQKGAAAKAAGKAK